MSVTNVYHKSREASFTLNFSATENNLSWTFTPENDGEIYDVVLNNVASYTVVGAAITLPYSLTGGTSYSVSIAKTTNGQSASITFKTRRALNKSTNISVPDFGLYDGRYAYCLSVENQEVYKVDKSLFNPQNYAGDGNFIVNPLIQIIALPVANANNIGEIPVFSMYAFNPIDNCVYFATGNTNRPIICICKMNVSTGAITDLDGNINASTTVYSGVNAVSDVTRYFFTWDYLSNKAILYTNRGFSIFNNETKSATILGLNLNSVVFNSSMFNPTSSIFAGAGDYNYDRSINYKESLINAWAYNKNNGLTYSSDGNLIYRIRGYGINGKVQDSHVSASSTISSTAHYTIDSDNNIILVTGHGFNIGFQPLSPKSFTLFSTPVGMQTEGDTLYRGNAFTHYDHSWILFSSNRIVGFDPAEVDPLWGYLDLPSVVRGVVFNRILI